LRQIADKFNEMQLGMIAANRVFAIIDTKTRFRIRVQSSAHFPWKPEVQRRTFQLYSDEVIKGIDLGVNAGETVAIVGSTGAGKSTIINLLNRFYEIDSGEICIDNQNIERYTLESLRNQIAVVLQDVFLCRHGFQ
jgi:ABC-type multidrug transport system fused ATPase/permease subunit